jgi:hypothetical protein
MGIATAKTKANSKAEAHKLYGELIGLAMRFEANGLDASPVMKAAKCLAQLAAEVDTVLAEERARYQPQLNQSEAEMLRRENEELKARLALQPTR